MNRRGNCYYATEALFHILGGRRAGWKAMRLTLGEGQRGGLETHWFLLHQSGVIVDPSRRQFQAKDWWPAPDYSQGRGAGFLTKRPSRKARKLIELLTWQHQVSKSPKRGRRA